MKKLFIILICLLIFTLFGCTQVNDLLQEKSKIPEEIVFATPEVQDFVLDHPDYSFSFIEYSKSDFLKEIKFWQQCPIYVKEDDFYLATFDSNNLNFYFLFDKINIELICGLFIEKETFSVPEANVSTVISVEDETISLD
ncbi:MAG: hypothetical protein PHQ98_01575 [Candidatus ainarchaeum sp.]|nr:hypothetical protein [Candidatus ainarchaeum sp.]